MLIWINLVIHLFYIKLSGLGTKRDRQPVHPAAHPIVEVSLTVDRSAWWQGPWWFILEDLHRLCRCTASAHDSGTTRRYGLRLTARKRFATAASYRTLWCVYIYFRQREYILRIIRYKIELGRFLFAMTIFCSPPDAANATIFVWSTGVCIVQVTLWKRTCFAENDNLTAERFFSRDIQQIYSRRNLKFRDHYSR